MSKPQTPYDFSQLAAQFLDLWQKQVVATFNDPKVVGATLEALRATGNMTGSMQAGAYDTARTNKSSGDSAAGLHRSGDDALRQLEKRLATLEKRLDSLEGRAKKSGGKSPKRAKKRTRK